MSVSFLKNVIVDRALWIEEGLVMNHFSTKNTIL